MTSAWRERRSRSGISLGKAYARHVRSTHHQQLYATHSQRGRHDMSFQIPLGNSVHCLTERPKNHHYCISQSQQPPLTLIHCRVLTRSLSLANLVSARSYAQGPPTLVLAQTYIRLYETAFTRPRGRTVEGKAIALHARVGSAAVVVAGGATTA